MAAALTLQEVLLGVRKRQQWQHLLGEGCSLLPTFIYPLSPNLGWPAFASTDVAEFTAAAAPGVVMLGQGPFGFLQAEGVERVTANLAEHQLGMEREKAQWVPVGTKQGLRLRQ